MWLTYYYYYFVLDVGLYFTNGNVTTVTYNRVRVHARTPVCIYSTYVSPAAVGANGCIQLYTFNYVDWCRCERVYTVVYF